MSQTIKELEDKIKKAAICGAIATVTALGSGVGLIYEAATSTPKTRINEEGKLVIIPSQTEGELMAYGTFCAFLATAAFSRKSSLEKKKDMEIKAMMAQKQKARD